MSESNQHGFAAVRFTEANENYEKQTWSMDWEHTALLGNVTEHVLRDVSIDDYVFAEWLPRRGRATTRREPRRSRPHKDTRFVLSG